jgi:hypothetical protein
MEFSKVPGMGIEDMGDNIPKGETRKNILVI